MESKQHGNSSSGNQGGRLQVKGTQERKVPMHVPPEMMWNEGEKYCQEQVGKRDHVEHIYNKTVFSEVPDMNVWRFLEQRHVVYVAVMDSETGDVWNCPVFAKPRPDKLSRSRDDLTVPEAPLAPELSNAISLTEQQHVADEIEIMRESSDEGDVVHEGDQKVMYVRPWDPSSAGTAIGNFTSPYQSSSYHPLVQIVNRREIRILRSPHKDDPLWRCLQKPGTLMSLNFLEHETRTRWRSNGVLKDPITRGGFGMSVREVFCTCPRYITERTVVALQREGPGETVFSDQKVKALPDKLLHFITHADTFLIATMSPSWGADSSHRGGRPGFIRVIDKHILLWPDYHGMYKFQTLGNTVLYPRGGLLFMDYFRGHTLQLTGRMKLHFLGDQKQYYMDGRSRIVTFEVDKWIYRERSCPFLWRLIKFSSTLPVMSDSPILYDMFSKEHGHQCEVLSNIEPFKERGVIHARVREVVARSKSVKSFIFESTDGQHFEYMSGMWATFTLFIKGESNMRNWTLSSGNCTLLDGIPISPNEFFSDTFEISVKNTTKGVTSPWLHRTVEKGTMILLNGMEGRYTLNASRRALLRDLISGRIGGMKFLNNDKLERALQKRQEFLQKPAREWWKILMISGGIGVTPIAGMLRSLEIMCHERGIITADQLPDISLVHSESELDEIAFAELFQHMYCGLGDAPIIQKLAFTLTKEDRNDSERILSELRRKTGRSEHDDSIAALVGERLSADFIEDVVPDVRNRFVYLCGPPKFMEVVKKHLVSLRVPLERILTENFSD